ncbi:MAG: TolC family outer membrane protein [Azoarcus sp.]|jgi:adhesin transport system outer membrane protein|nr:TolC family outer membrane protein [Azoarcus sp.]
MSRIKTLVCLAVVATLQTVPGISGAQAPAEPSRGGALLDAVRKAVVSNPDVQAAWHGYHAATAAQDAARGGYLPEVDVNAAAGRRWRKDPHEIQNGKKSNNWNYSDAALELNQLIYDGFATSSEVSRMGYQRLVRYYELLDASENAGLEVTRAYADVERQRELVEHAKANYAAHKQLYDQINNRTTAGVSRRVDLDQAAGRLALAESNLLTEVSNLHDVSTRYQRLVGELPADRLPPLADNFANVSLPENVVAALRTAYVNNPSFNAAIENVRANASKRDVARSAYHPKLSLHASTGIDRNIDNDERNLKGNRRESLVEVLFSFNVFRGGADRARVRQAGEEVDQARNLREKACRDLRQTLTIAYQDTRSLVEKLGYLDLHQSSTAKAREAYRRQFDIGQRTLLDLLDSENEYFNARRAYTNARFDLLVAQARTLSGTGQLLHTLGVVREDLPTARDAGQDRDTVDPAEMCPADAPAPLEVNKSTLLTTEAAYR